MSSPHTLDPDAIADCVLNTFDGLPQKSKPRTLADGRREWSPLAGIVLSRRRHFFSYTTCFCQADWSALRSLGHNHDATRNGLDDTTNATLSTSITYAPDGDCQPPELTCAALATGMKCLPASKVALAGGNVLHDWHAEVLAIRGFNRWILEECAELAQQGRSGKGQWVDWTQEDEQQEQPSNLVDNATAPRPPFKLKPDVQIHMFCSQAPCGDASMELTMAAQQDATPWTKAAPSSKPEDMLGRGHFDRLGVVRRKPARPDAPVTMSKSCSDKLALKQVTGLLSGTVAKVVQVEGCYMRTLVMPEAEIVDNAVTRAFGRGGRMKLLDGWKERRSGYSFRPFDVRKSARKFAYSAQGAEAGGSNLSALWTPRRQEILVNGVLQGRKQFDVRGASSASRKSLWKFALEVAVMAGLPAVVKSLKQDNYGMAKGIRNDARQRAKEAAWQKALIGWKRNERDDAWGLDDV